MKTKSKISNVVRNEVKKQVYNLACVAKSLKQKKVFVNFTDKELKYTYIKHNVVYDKYRNVKVLQPAKVTVPVSPKTICIHNSDILGNKSLGKIDYLVNHCGYTIAGINNYKFKLKLLNVQN